MKITLWYESHNPHERLAAKFVAAKYPGARLVDVSTWTAMRDRPSESGWPDRHVRAFPCLVFDGDDGLVELERVEENLNASDVEKKESLAKAHEKRVKAALTEAHARTDVAGGARPIAISYLRVSSEPSDSAVSVSGPVRPKDAANAQPTPAKSAKAKKRKT